MFYTIRRFLSNLFVIVRKPPILTAAGTPEPNPGKYRAKIISEVIIQVILTLLLAPACVYVLLSSGYTEDIKKAASGALGTVVGYWFR